ncbi:MAG: emp24/gp25L/p24 family protein [Candidatus Bathyarchaeota archaeon]|nr:emp24/gp25L/p24 family protein [Candidatus Bathyarchaeota archaeon]
MKGLLAVLCVLLAFVSACGFAIAYSETIELPGGKSEIRTVNLNEGDEFSGQVIVLGNAINFSVSDPDGMIILNYTIANPTNFRFTAAKTGTYSFSFENRFSEEIKSVTLNYNVQHYIFGFPQEYILLFVIVGLAIVGVVVFVAVSPKP